MLSSPPEVPITDGRGADRPAYGRLLNGLTWRRVFYTLLVTAGLALWTGPGSWMLEKRGWNPQLEIVGIRDFLVDRGWGWVFVFMVYLPIFFSQMLSLTFADNLRIPRIPRGALLVIALLLGTTLGSAVVVLLTNDLFGVVAGRGLAWGGLVALVYFKRRRDEELAVALHAVQLTQVELRKKATESHLQLVQARVEPQFLFNTLRRVGNLYEIDRASADQMPDTLIAYLRAALPQMRTCASTLGQEVQLARAYLDIERGCAQGELDFAFGIPDRLLTAAFPPMVLLPLIEALMPRDRTEVGGGEVLRGDARVDAGMLRLLLATTPLRDARPTTDEIESIRSRLTALYGTDGKLRLEPLHPRGAVATLDLPYVPS